MRQAHPHASVENCASTRNEAVVGEWQDSSRPMVWRHLFGEVRLLRRTPGVDKCWACSQMWIGAGDGRGTDDGSR